MGGILSPLTEKLSLSRKGAFILSLSVVFFIFRCLKPPSRPYSSEVCPTLSRFSLGVLILHHAIAL